MLFNNQLLFDWLLRKTYRNGQNLIKKKKKLFDTGILVQLYFKEKSKKKNKLRVVYVTFNLSPSRLHLEKKNNAVTTKSLDTTTSNRKLKKNAETFVACIDPAYISLAGVNPYKNHPANALI